MRQLLWADVHGERMHFQPLYAWLAGEVVFSADRARLDTLPPQCRAKLLLVMAAFTPYYTPPQARTSNPIRLLSVCCGMKLLGHNAPLQASLACDLRQREWRSIPKRCSQQ